MSLTLQEVRDLLSCEVVVDPGGLDQIEIERGGGADLMSDVLAFVNPGALLLTGLTNAQTVRTALVVDATAVVYVRSKEPDPDSIALAKRHKLPLLRTPLTLFESCGRLYAAGLRGCTRTPEGSRVADELSS